MELLDKNCSTQVRPATVVAAVGRRIHVRVRADVDAEYVEENPDDDQVRSYSGAGTEGSMHPRP